MSKECIHFFGPLCIFHIVLTEITVAANHQQILVRRSDHADWYRTPSINPFLLQKINELAIQYCTR